MLSRRVLRIKAMQVLYGYFGGNTDSIDIAEKQLNHSIQKSFDLFYFLLSLIVEIQFYAEKKIETSKNKFLPSDEDLNPNMKFINNSLIDFIKSNDKYKTFFNNKPYSWINNQDLIKNIYSELIVFEPYIKYMASNKTSFEDDKKIVQLIYSDIIADNDLFFSVLEEHSIYWNDDVEFIISMIIKYIASVDNSLNTSSLFLDVYTNNEDKEFVKTLLSKTIFKHKENNELISKYTRNWEVERIASIDVLLMEMALVEFIEMAYVPVKVTLNEYIDLAKYYSTEKSSSFINGVLDQLIIYLRENKLINKQGKGLLGDKV